MREKSTKDIDSSQCLTQNLSTKPSTFAAKISTMTNTPLQALNLPKKDHTACGNLNMHRSQNYNPEVMGLFS